MSLPPSMTSLDNPQGWPSDFAVPIDTARLPADGRWSRYVDVLYQPAHVTSDWVGYQAFLAAARPALKPRVLLVSHDMTEIENITLMALGGVVKAMNGAPSYLLAGEGNIHRCFDVIEATRPEWIGLSLYTGLTGYFFTWLRAYKIDRARRIFRKDSLSFEDADALLKGLVREAGGPVYDGGRLIYAPVVVGGHYNNYNFKDSWERGGDYVLRGKGINLLRDILLRLLPPGIYHDPMPHANIPRMDRAGFYADTFAFSDATKKFALSPIKSVITALGCSYSCSYCYISSLVNNLKEAYQGSGVTPPSIIQDRPLGVVLQEGEDIVALDPVYGVRTTAVFDQADISLNNIAWWEGLRDEWVERVNIPFYIQARPGMLAGKRGYERIQTISKKKLVSGISMAIESGDPNVRRYLLSRHEPDSTILSAIANVKCFDLPLRTQAIVALPVLRPLTPVRPAKGGVSLVSPQGEEYYYDDPIQESLKCLALVGGSGFAREDYYWNSLYSPFPGTPLGDYCVAAGFADDETDARAYQFTMDSGLKCFSGLTSRRQVAFSQTSNFFAHVAGGAALMERYLYGRERFGLEDFGAFVGDNAAQLVPRAGSPRHGLIPDFDDATLGRFFAHAYGDDDEHRPFRELNRRLVPYYRALLDGLVLAARVAVHYRALHAAGKALEMAALYRVERNHYYDNSYNMAALPEIFRSFLEPLRLACSRLGQDGGPARSA